MSKNLDEFLAFYNGNDEHPVTEIEVPLGHGKGDSPFIILRSGKHTVIVNPLEFSDHLSVDIHSFTNGEAATSGVLAMNEGCTTQLENTPSTSHGWPSAQLITILVGKQA